MLRRGSWARAALGACLAAALGLPGAVWARSDVSVPPDLLDGTYRGMQGFLELDGKNIHNCGNVLLHITNFGLIGSQPGSNRTYSGAPSAQWPKGSPTEYLWSAGLWIGAEKNGEKHVTTGQYEIEFRPGRTDLDRIYRSRELAAGGARQPAPNADDDRDGRTDEDWLDGRDNDGDGKIDEDFVAISNQMFFCEYNDTDPAIKLRWPEHVPLEMLVQQSSLCWESPLVDDFIAFDFRLILDPRADPLDNVYLGFFADCDIGPRGEEQVAEDDYSGFWEGIRQARLGNQFKNVKVSVGYMFDDDTDEGKSEGYIGLMFLGAQDPNAEGPPRPITLHNFRMFSGKASFDQGGDPNNDEERYRVLDGTAPKSLPPVGEGELRPPAMAKKKDDYRMTVSAGPFVHVDPGDTLGFQAALVIGRGFEGMVENAVQAQLTYDGAYLDCDEDPATGVDGREAAICPPAAGEDPLPPQPINACDTTCVFVPTSDPRCYVNITPTSGCLYVNADCDVELQTGVPTGVEGKECLIHWLIGTAPPPPNMRLVECQNRVDVLWDNRSETTPDLRLNVLDFESYRIWRADNWTRPFGTDINTGPGGDLWMLLAEYDLPDNRIGSDVGLESIRYWPDVPDHAVQYYREWFRSHPFVQPPVLLLDDKDEEANEAKNDTARALARGVRYYRFTDPPLLRGGRTAGPCPPAPCPSCPSEPCPTLMTERGPVNTRCNPQGLCQETAPPPHSGAHYFYSVTATDHKLEVSLTSGALVPAGPGLAGDPSSNFLYVAPPTRGLAPEQAGDAEKEIYVVPNPATPKTMQPWKLDPTNDDPTGTKIEFHHLPLSSGKVTIFTLSGDMVKELPFDGESCHGSMAWDLVSRNGQDVTSGIYLFSVEADDGRFERFVGKFVVIR